MTRMQFPTSKTNFTWKTHTRISLQNFFVPWSQHLTVWRPDSVTMCGACQSFRYCKHSSVTVRRVSTATNLLVSPGSGFCDKRSCFRRERSLYVRSVELQPNREATPSLPQFGDVVAPPGGDDVTSGGDVTEGPPGGGAALTFTLAVTRLCHVVCRMCKSRSNQVRGDGGSEAPITSAASSTRFFQPAHLAPPTGSVWRRFGKDEA